MFRGKTLFKCTECGKHFMAADIELGGHYPVCSAKVPQVWQYAYPSVRANTPVLPYGIKRYTFNITH